MDNIIGQRQLKIRLSQMMDKLSHAYIFSGPDGIGKRTVASSFAAVILCENPVVDGLEGKLSSCGSCRGCAMFLEGTHPDIKFLDTEGSNLLIDELRTFIEDVSIRPLYSSKKVYIIVGGDRLTPQAQNALLKTFEEPPAYITFIITATNLKLFLPTILSRAARIDFERNTYEEVRFAVEAIAKKTKASTDTVFTDYEIGFIVQFSEGIIGKAKRLASSQEFRNMRDEAIEIARKVSFGGLLDAFAGYKFFEQNRKDIDILLDFLSIWFRDISVAKKIHQSSEQKLLINHDKKDIIISNAASFSDERLFYICDVIDETRKAIKSNANFQLAIEVMLMKIQGDTF